MDTKSLFSCTADRNDPARQLYVPVSNALGLASSFRELEEVAYKTLFPQTYATLTLWHDDVRAGWAALP